MHPAHCAALCDVLSELRLALDAENGGELRKAVSHYQQACALSSSLASLVAQPGTASDSAATLDGLLQTFSCRVSMLLSNTTEGDECPTPGSSTEHCCTAAAAVWVPPTERAAQPTADAWSDTSVPSHLCQQCSLPQPHPSFPPGQVTVAPSSHPAAAGPEDMLAMSAELLRLCQRTPRGSLEDVIGMEQVKQELQEALFLPMQYPELFMGIRVPPKTFLLHGPPGTGKTLVVEKIAAEAHLTLLVVTPSTILSKWHGESEGSLRTLFDLARTKQPALVFIDEVDSLGASRSASNDGAARHVLVELLLQMTQAEQEPGVYIFGATNRVQDCDPALLRRFERRIPIPLPGPQQRSNFITTLLERSGVSFDLAPQQLAALGTAAEAYSCSDLTALCRQAALEPVRELLAARRASLTQPQQQVGSGGKRPKLAADSAPGDVSQAADAVRPVSHEDFLSAMKRIAATMRDAGLEE